MQNAGTQIMFKRCGVGAGIYRQVQTTMASPCGQVSLDPVRAMSSELPTALRFRTLRPIVLGALSGAYTIYLVQNADPRLRNSAVWLPALQMLGLWILADPVRWLLNRPGGKWSVSWMPAGPGGGEASKGENGWTEAIVQGGLVSVASFAWMRAFVGLDAASAVAFLVSYASFLIRQS